jgi:predicted HNH restriction endonuclease
MNETSDNKPLVAGMAKAKVMLDCGADTLYDLIKAGELESYLEGKFRKITTASIERHIENRLAAGGKWICGKCGNFAAANPPPLSKTAPREE